MNQTSLDLDEYDDRMQMEIAKRRALARDLFLVAIFFLLSSAGALFYGAPVIAGILFFLSILCKDGASETRIEIGTIETNWFLALLINKQLVELEAMKSRLVRLEDVPEAD